MTTRRPLRANGLVKPINRERRSRMDMKLWGPDGFVEFVHRCDCAVPGCRSWYVEAAHARSRAAGGDWTDILPLCRDHHREQHQAGILTFERTHGLDMLAAAAATQRRWRELTGDVPPEAA